MKFEDFEDFEKMLRKKIPPAFDMVASDAFDYVVVACEKINVEPPDGWHELRDSLYELPIDPDKIPFEDFIKLAWIMAKYEKEN